MFPAVTTDKIAWFTNKQGKWQVTQPPQGLIKPAVAEFYLVSVPDDVAAQAANQDFYGLGDDKFVGLKFNTDGTVKYMIGDGMTAKVERAIRSKVWAKYSTKVLPEFNNVVLTDIVFLSVVCEKCGKFKRPVDCIDDSGETWSKTCKECRHESNLT